MSTTIESVILHGDYRHLNVTPIQHQGPCGSSALAIARDTGVVTGISCFGCAAPQHCEAATTNGPHGAYATRATPAGWRCRPCADEEGWPVAADAWSYDRA